MPPSLCNPDLLHRSLSDQLSELQEEALAEHLEHCETCRLSLDSLASGDGDWKRIEGVLRNETTGQHAVTEPRTTLVPDDASKVQHPHSIGVPIETSDFAVDFLEPSDRPEAIGQLNNIEIRSIIGHGGNGIVLKGFQEELQRLVAVKVMAPQLATSAAARKRFAREAQATAAIVHPNVMPILTVHSEGQLPYLVMPYVDCESLQDRIDGEGPLPLPDVLRIGHQVANGLAAAHAQGLVHRDVKPANILLERGVDRVMLTDFGLARAVDDGTLTRTGIIAGTPQYMSPEQARGDSVDTRSDLFSLGSVLYAMCTGRPPFRAETTYGILKRVIDEKPRAIATLNSELPDWLSGYVHHLMSKSATARTENAEQIGRTLERCIAHVQQPHVNELPETVRAFARSARIPLRWILTTAVVAVLMAAAFAWWNPVGHVQPSLRTESVTLSDSGSSEAPPKSSASSDPPGTAENASTVIDDDDSAVVEWSSSIDSELQDLEQQSNQLLDSLSDSTF